ncbi:hypothetical protein SAMD00019534_078690 [Acytostelium subglobosum LB1]|uniref:hypothetical protein n=1 Tax=Acytostelium subglobosum LB1 TaxID=1410327 RepID=UPI000645203B|nr:hypothetical protein SAMD00019534_078690 [Acytostelium subglobosum LB1]GAM24694.1 hypothetical protein SAMD00019534_078690 [Acytostelium subglobosum LB1]|eukprot:XP_012752363.1 hypothetical protein SAMD00019534_078690 [Acytostelium subglobosum LB1]
MEVCGNSNIKRKNDNDGDGDVDDDILRCSIHNKKQKVICYDCNELICTVCLTTQHMKHEVEHVHSLKTQFTSDNQRIKRFNARLDTLWDTLQQLAWSYDTIQMSKRRVANQFRELHEHLMRKEQRLKKKLDDELDDTTTSINNIINEVANINTNVTNNNVNDINHNDDEDGDGVDVMSTLVRSIKTSKSMDQFIDKQFKPCDDNVTIGDDQLLDFVRRASQATQAVHTVTRPLRMNHIFSFWKDSCSMLSLDTGEWTVINDKCTPRKRISRSVVYARGNVYVFGGQGSPSTYSRFSLIDQKWNNDLEIIGVDGGESISTCYDGDKRIYLVGGFHNDKLLDRVDCFNIDTQQFSSVGRLSVPTRASHSFIHNNRIIVVGGHVDVEGNVSLTDILEYNIATKECVVSLEIDINPDEAIDACYDGVDNVIIMGGDESTLLVDMSMMNNNVSQVVFIQRRAMDESGKSNNIDKDSIKRKKDDGDVVGDDNDTIRCLIHNMKPEVMCYDCNELICTDCLTTTQHIKHDVEHVDSLKTQFTSNKRIKRFDTRLDTLWDTLQGLAWSYDTIQISQRHVANQFRELHEYLMKKEQWLKKELDDELDKTTTSINNIINEIVNITAQATHNNMNDINHNDDEDGEGVDIMSQLVRSIQTSKTLDQFIDKQFKPCGDDVTIGDDQLLDFVQRASQATQAVHVVTKPLRFEFDSHMLERDIKVLFGKYIYESTPTRIEHGFRNHIFSFGRTHVRFSHWTLMSGL